ncbi:pentapeptide repeat-containing protein [Brachyspira sp.]|uniref:pentapeptide repeat-containing protein n=1 Tax=Brachyspira sp. TaxID=1977261 RepID=UPI003D7F16BB
MRNANFSWTLFNNEINFTGSKFIGGTDFYYTSFNNKVNFNFASFNNEVDFSHASFNNEVNFSNSIFKNKAYFSGGSFANKVNFSWTQFDNEVNFSITTFKEADFHFSKFYDKVDFSGALFDNEVDFSNSIFNNEVDFSNVSFDNKVDFSFVNFKNEIYFYGTSFNNASFTRTNFFKNIYFHGISISEKIEVLIDMKYDTEIKFDNVIFENTNSNLFIVNISNSKLNKISINNSNIDGKIILRNIKAENIDLKNVNTLGNLHIIGCDFDKILNSGTARALKNNEYKKANNIKALEYSSKEIEMHKEELKRKNNKSYKDWGDIISIELSSLYSDNGLNWIKSFLCTILFPTFFFTLSYNINYTPMFMYIFLSFIYFLFCNYNNKNDYNNKNIEEYIFISTIICLVVGFSQYIYFRDTQYIKELFNFIAPTDFSQISHENADTSYIYNCKSGIEIIFKGIFYFLGKIAFWYGSVQTVQSFRKFSKKE